VEHARRPPTAGPVAQTAGRVAGGVCLSYRTAVPVEPGLSARVSLVVGESDTALALRSGDVPVLGTPRLIALCEEAACQAVQGKLGDGRTSVGVRVQFDHLAPVRTGSEIAAEAILEKVEGRRLVFTVTASDGAGLVGAGKVTRVVVEREDFLAKAR
jgi:fluoroacetyl-CoA thioesterase